MTQATENVLREVLNRVDRQRRVATAMLYAMFAMMFAFWAAMCFAKNDHDGLAWGLSAVIAGGFLVRMMDSRESADNTRAILKAIELLADQSYSSR